jgi:branched-chain amino acid transport system substrate-binding protein
LKKIVFLIIASLLVIGLVLPGLVGADNPTIKVLIAGPMTYTQGTDMWKGATLAANEIKAAGGVDVGGAKYDFELVQVDTDEIDDYADAGTKLLAAITANPDAEFIIGGFRTEGVENMIPVAMSNNITMFICGAASYSLLNYCPYYPYVPAYSGYKYIFRGTPFNDVFLMNNAVMMLGMVIYDVSNAIKNFRVTTPKVAIFAESSAWADWMVAAAEAIIPVLGCTLGPVKRVSDTAAADEVIPALNEIKAAKCHAIFTVMSGPVGTIFSTQKGSLGITAIPVGINVEAQSPSFWGDTAGKCAYEITTGTWAPGVEQTDITKHFLDAFQAANNGEFPTYTAASYDVLRTLKSAMQDVGSIHNEDLISWYEDPANQTETTSGIATYYPKWDGSTFGYWTSVAGTNPLGAGDGILAALNSTQYDALYATLGYSTPYGTNFTMPPYTTHNLVYGPGYVTGIAFQWQ